jgi:hypothetical protein
MKITVSFLMGAILLWIVPFGIQGQPVRVSATLDSTRILIGDQVMLKLELEKPQSLPVVFSRVPDTLAGKIEVLQRSGIDTILSDNQREKLTQTFLVTCFDSGQYRIPPFRFDFHLDERYDSILTNELLLEVLTLEIDTTRGPTDVKMPYDAPLTLKEVTPYIMGITLVGALLFLLLYGIKRKKKNLPFFVKPSKPAEPPHVIALRELDRIREEKLWQKDKIKAFYSEITDVLRNYMEGRFGIPAMEQTTGEIMTSFQSDRSLISEKSLNYLHQILPMADLVKFAKYKPLPDDHQMALANAYFFVNDTKNEVPGTQVNGGEPEGERQEVTAN